LLIRAWNFKFQSTHPRGVRLGVPLNASCKLRSFNPRTHAGCDWLFF